MGLLRENLLAGRRVALGGTVAAATVDALRELGAEVENVAGEQLGDEEDRVGEWARAHAPLHALVWDGAGAFGAGGQAGLSTALAEAWAVVREVAVGALIPAGSPAKLVLVAPAPDAGPLADAARSGLENLARTLSVEWARHRLTAVLIAPGERTTEQELAQVVCFAVSEGGGYLSGCRLELGAAG